METFDPQCITYSQMNLIFNARLYYRRLTTWTRAYLMSRYFGIGTTEAQFERLYLETLDIGEMLQIIFGRQSSEGYSQLACQYAIAFHELITAQLAGDSEGVIQSVNRLYQNVEERADFLEALNPYWSVAEYRSLFNEYIQYIIETANAIAAGDFRRDAELYDILNSHTDRMGDTFAQGIYNYITSGGSIQNTDTLQTGDNVPCITYEQMNDIYTIRMFWFELVTWVRIYMLSRYVGVGDSEEAITKLMQILNNYVKTLKKFFPDMDDEEFLRLLTTYVELISAFITAMMENNVEELNRITEALYENADERSAFIASLNPFWDETEARNTLYVNMRTTIEESNTFLTGEYERNIDIFTRLLDQAETASTFLAQGLFKYITQNQQMQ